MKTYRILMIRFAWGFVCTGWLLAFSGSSAVAAEDSNTSPDATSAAAKKLTLDEWRSLKEMAKAIYLMPTGAERMAKSEAFLREHPEYPDPRNVLFVLLNDHLKVEGYDPSHAAELVERMSRLGEGGDGSYGLYLVEDFSLPYHLPPESARRILKQSRRDLESKRQRFSLSPGATSSLRSKMAALEFRLLLDEGRVLLQSGDAVGALKKLQEAEACRRQEGTLLGLQDVRSGTVKYLPSQSSDLNWLYLTMAQAYARLGQPAAARERLGWVEGTASPEDAFDPAIERLSKDLKAPPRDHREMHAEPPPAPDFTLKDLEGNQVRLSDYKGKTVLVLLWATW